MSSAKKLEEAQFFLELLDALEQRQHPLTHAGDKAKEASYLYSAILNAFYSVCDMMRRREGFAAETEAFMQAHPEIYKYGKGERAKTVHIRHIDTAHSGYHWTAGNDFDAPRVKPILIREREIPGRVDFYIGPINYMDIELLDTRVPVTKFCFDHFYILRNFHAKCFGGSR
jgi:hypothetical protein